MAMHPGISYRTLTMLPKARAPDKPNRPDIRSSFPGQLTGLPSFSLLLTEMVAEMRLSMKMILNHR
jgi:hypothetical protein